MNYNSIEEIFSAGITNMTVLRNNTKQDDGTDTITGVDWFNFNGTVASTIYANGNSWLGFGSSSEHLKVNRIDSALWSLYREEGTLYNYFKFLKIRWKGYSRYNYTSTAYAVEYDVILWDTGDISLHMISIPTKYANGTYSLVASSTYTYTVSTSSPDVTFKKTDTGFEVQNNIINLVILYDKRYLVRDGEMIYTISNNTLTSLGSVTLTSTLFLDSGYDPDLNGMFELSILNGLSNPELLYWHEELEAIDDITKLIIEGTPSLPQFVTYAPETIPDGSALKIIEAQATRDVLFAITFDGGTTWKYRSGNVWVDAESESDGMNTNTLNTMTEPLWAEVATSNTYQIRCALPSIESTITKIMVGYV